MDIVEKLASTALGVWTSAMTAAPSNNGKFRVMLSFNCGDEVKPLLLVGIVHGRCEDGHVVAVLNPDECLVDGVSTAATGERFTEMLAGRCDMAIDVWNDAYRADGARIYAKYKARTPQPAKFVVA